MNLNKEKQIEKYYDITEQFDTPTARRLQRLRAIKRPTSKLANEYLQICIGFSQERARIFKKILEVAKDDEPMRAEVKDLSLTLFRKIATLMTVKQLNNFSEENGFFVYNPYNPKIIAVTPKGNFLEYWMIEGIRMRAMDIHLMGKLVRIGYFHNHTAYLQPKVLDHEEYEHLIELLGRELEEEQKQKEGR